MNVPDFKNLIDFSNLYDNFQDGIAVSDPESKLIVEANPAWLKMTGYTKEDIQKKLVSIKKIHSEEKLSTLNTKEKQLFQNKKLLIHHWDVQRKDGKIFFVDIHAYLILIENKEYVLGIFRDVSNEMKTNKAIEKSEERFRRVFLDSAVGMVLADLNGKFLQINDSFCEISGYSREELMKITFREITHPDDLLLDLKNFKKLLKKEITSFTIEKRYIHKNGTTVWILLTVSYLSDENGDPSYIIGQVQDISEQKLTESQLTQALEKAKELSEAKSLFLANMSHEIRTPMNGVLGVLQLLQESTLNSDQNFLVEIARSSAESLLTIINDILDFSKIEAGKLTLNQKYFNLKFTLSSVQSLLRYQAKEKGIDFMIDYQFEKDILFLGDESRIRQIIINLAGNAVKFTEKGEIKITAKSEITKNKLKNLVINISDTGIGIPEEQLEKIFQIFEQADNTPTRKFGGTGLGLSISKQLANMMNGDIHVKSIYGKGSNFSLILPGNFIQSDPHTENNNKTSYLPANVVVLGNKTILDKFLYAYYYNDCAYTIEHYHAKTFDEFIEYINKLLLNKARILTFVSSSNYDGTLTPFLQKKKHNPQFRNIYYSENFYQGEAESAGMNGFHGYLTSPVDQQTLWKMVCAVMNLDNSNIENDFIITKYLLNMNSNTKNIDLDLNNVDKKNGHDKLFTNKKVLLVEDNIINQMVATRMLKKFFVHCEVTENGKEALKKLKKEKYDLIFMDIQMPEMDGLETAQKIRRELKIKIPIIAMTADVMEEDKIKAIESGMNDYITKPVEQDILESMIRKWLQKGKD